MRLVTKAGPASAEYVEGRGYPSTDEYRNTVTIVPGCGFLACFTIPQGRGEREMRTHVGPEELATIVRQHLTGTQHEEVAEVVAHLIRTAKGEGAA